MYLFHRFVLCFLCTCTCFNERCRRKEEASKVKQTTKQSSTAHPRQSLVHVNIQSFGALFPLIAVILLQHSFGLKFLAGPIMKSLSILQEPARKEATLAGICTALGVLRCFALFVCLTLLASFFLPSHLSFKNMYMYAKLCTRFNER